MPKSFDRCISAGGRVRTKKLGSGKYMRVCFLNGRAYPGHIKQKQAESPSKYSEGLKK